MTEQKKPRGLAAMTPERRREIQGAGGRAISRDRDHMAQIGRKGGRGSKGPRRLQEFEGPRP